MLRHYDQLGLLRPSVVDDETGYRYYSLAQLDVAEAIRLLRDLDVPLTEVSDILAAPDRECTERLLANHRKRIGDILARQQAIMDRVEDTLTRGATLMPQNHKITVVEMPEITAVSVRGESGPAVEQLTAALAACEKQLRASMSKQVPSWSGSVFVLHDIDLYAPWYSRTRFEVCALLGPSDQRPDGSWVLPGCPAACTVYRGQRDGLRSSWAALLSWVERSDYTAQPPMRTTYSPGIEIAHSSSCEIDLAIPVTSRCG